MIITRTPVRVSLLGGGTDYPSWSREHGGLVVGGAVDKYSYVTARLLPNFHSYRYRVVYSKTEQVNEPSEIEHRAARACVEKWFPSAGVEIFHACDLPGRSGTGSSSTFVVGLTNALCSLKGVRLFAHELAQEAMRVEQVVLGETVGCQDQTFAAHGGLNVVRFRRTGDIDVFPLALTGEHVRELEANLMLFFTGQHRTSSEVAATYVPTIAQKKAEQFAMMRLAEQGIDAVHRREWQRLGGLVDQSWRIKAGMSEAVTNAGVNGLYAAARLAGAFGGKLTGAGGGGCMVLVAPPEKRRAVVDSLTALGCVHIPFKFDFSGSAVIFSHRGDNEN